jgi:hypothetical protein
MAAQKYKHMNITKQQIDSFIEELQTKTKANGVNFIVGEESTVKYFKSDLRVSGYFIDYGTPTLAIATGKEVNSWFMILLHESSHMDQWIEKSPYWTNSFIDGKEAVDYIDEWLNGKDFDDEFLNSVFEKAIMVELDCERRTIQKAKDYGFEIDFEDEIKKANSYILFYRFIQEFKKWYGVDKAPYQIKEVWQEMPSTFDIDYSKLSDDLKDLYNKYCV